MTQEQPISKSSARPIWTAIFIEERAQKRAIGESKSLLGLRDMTQEQPISKSTARPIWTIIFTEERAQRGAIGEYIYIYIYL